MHFPKQIEFIEQTDTSKSQVNVAILRLCSKKDVKKALKYLEIIRPFQIGTIVSFLRHHPSSLVGEIGRLAAPNVPPKEKGARGKNYSCEKREI